MMFYTIIDLIASLVLGFCLTMFYIYLYGDNEKVVHKWSFVGHWSLRVGFIYMILGVILKVWTMDSVTFSQCLFDIGITLVFLWAYLFHRQLFKNKFKNQ